MDSRQNVILADAGNFYLLTDVADSPFMTLDLLRMLCGEHIGSGSYRAVFDCRVIKRSVIKVVWGQNTNCNMLEWNVWQAVKDTEWAKWFAPCYYISPGGHYLIQAKTKPIKPGQKLPKQMPGLFTDFHTGNFGYIGKRLVCHDYQFIIRAVDIAMNIRRVVEWR